MQKVIINPSFGGINSGIVVNNFIEKDFNLKLAKSLSNKLTSLGINNYLIRNNDITLTTMERLNLINNLINSNDEVIVLTIELLTPLENGVKIIYSLKNNDSLSRDLSTNLEKINLEVIKYYQLRNPNSTNEDYYELIREPNNSENIIVSLGNPNNSIDNNYLLNNIDSIANSIATSLNTYLKNSNIYIVQRGDTLFSIANKFNVSIDDLKRINNLSSNALIIGNELIIPNSKEISNDETGLDEEENMYINYQVLKGDSLYSISKKYNVSIDIIKDVNNLTNNELSIGQILKIPTSTTSINNEYNNYTVLKGDSLYSIANKFNTTVNEIKSLNNLTSNILSIGQNLKIPTINGQNDEITNYTTYIVKSGDSLYKIASLYQTSINEIKNLNNLTSNILSIGQSLKIPKNNISTKTYTVVSGDSLYKIANKFNTSVNELITLNNLSSNLLSIGQVLKLP